MARSLAGGPLSVCSSVCAYILIGAWVGVWIHVYYIGGMINVVVVIAWGCDLVSGVWLESCIAFGTRHHFLVWCGCEVYTYMLQVLISTWFRTTYVTFIALSSEILCDCISICTSEFS